jgi:NSS family neurotransmitter:Na+ symporter
VSDAEPYAAVEARQTFATRAGAIVTMVGVAIGLGNFWRFPYLVGRYGGAAFVVFYLLVVLAVGVPGLMAEWALGRHTRRGTVGAYERAGVPFGRFIGWFFFAIVLAATAYYSVAIGWVLCFAAAALLSLLGMPLDAARVLPPDRGFDGGSLALQLVFTALVILAAGVVLSKGLRGGIERVSRLLIPGLFVILVLLIARAVTLPGASAGVAWYVLKFQPGDLTGRVMVAALGQAVFSLSLGGTFMVVYGSYLSADVDLRTSAAWTAGADTAAGLLAGFAIFPAVFALGLEPASGPGLIFATLPRVFDAIPLGAVFALLFFIALFVGGLLSDIAAFEVLVAGLTDNTRLRRPTAIYLLAAAALALAVPPMINMRIFVPWDLTFGSGMQTLGALLAVLTFAWALDRSAALRQLARDSPADPPPWLYYWLRFVVPGGILLVGIWWLLTEVLRVTGAA